MHWSNLDLPESHAKCQMSSAMKGKKVRRIAVRCLSGSQRKFTAPIFPGKNHTLTTLRWQWMKRTRPYQKTIGISTGHGMNCLNCYAVWFHRLLVDVGWWKIFMSPGLGGTVCTCAGFRCGDRWWQSEAETLPMLSFFHGKKKPWCLETPRCQTIVKVVYVLHMFFRICPVLLVIFTIFTNFQSRSCKRKMRPWRGNWSCLAAIAIVIVLQFAIAMFGSELNMIRQTYNYDKHTIKNLAHISYVIISF